MMTAPRLPIHNRSPLLPTISKDSGSHSDRSHDEAQMLETSVSTVMPCMLDGSYLDVSNFNQFNTFSQQTMPHASFVPPYPWLEQPCSDLDGRNCYDCTTESSLTSASTPTPYEDSGDYEQVQTDTWGYGISYDSTRSSSPSTSSLKQEFWSSNETEPCFRISSNNRQRPILPLPNISSERSSWENPTYTTATHGLPDLRPAGLHDYEYNPLHFSEPSRHSMMSNIHESLSSNAMWSYGNTDATSTIDSAETDTESVKGEPPYAKLIYNALMDAPEHKLVLRDIYAWISINTEKARDPAFKGWQNSVRHNLSMNGV